VALVITIAAALMIHCQAKSVGGKKTVCQASAADQIDLSEIDGPMSVYGARESLKLEV
jgi:hypothetical protein